MHILFVCINIYHESISLAQSTKFTRGTRTAASIYLRYKQDGVYAVDVDKSHDVDETVLSVMVSCVAFT